MTYATCKYLHEMAVARGDDAMAKLYKDRMDRKKPVREARPVGKKPKG